MHGLFNTSVEQFPLLPLAAESFPDQLFGCGWLEVKALFFDSSHVGLCEELLEELAVELDQGGGLGGVHCGQTGTERPLACSGLQERLLR